MFISRKFLSFLQDWKELFFAYTNLLMFTAVDGVDLSTASSIRQSGFLARGSQSLAVLSVTVAAAARHSRRWFGRWLVFHFFVIPSSRYRYSKSRHMHSVSKANLSSCQYIPSESNIDIIDAYACETMLTIAEFKGSDLYID